LSGETQEATTAPATRFMRVSPQGRAYIEGYRCNSCGAVYLDERVACSRCASRDEMTPFEASDKGVVHTYSIVHRSFPGIPVPFISVIVDLDDGLVLKGTLLGVDPKPSTDLFGLPIRVVFKPAGEHKTAQGVPYVTYFFEPA
jgi:uncharacterized OB-fold protein